MPEEKKFSFAKAGGPAAQPVEEQKPAAPGVEASPAATSGTVATTPEHQPPAFYTGEEDEPFDPQDQRLPRLNIVQKSSQAEWLKHGVGSLILKGEIPVFKGAVAATATTAAIPATPDVRLVVIGARPKIWIEKTKFNSSIKPRFARSIDEVVKFGGTDQWKFSKENDKIVSVKPWFMPSVTLAVLIEKPAGLAPEHEAHFAYVVGDKAYAAALLSVKSTNYDAVWVTISSERRGVLSQGFNSRFINAHVFMKAFSGGEAGVFKLTFGEETSVELRAVAQRIVTGN